MRIETLSLILFVTILFGCRSHQSSSLSSDAARLVGRYYRGDGTGYNIYLNLLGNGKYDAQWRGCLGIYGNAKGTWTVINDKILFSPSAETRMMKGHLTFLHIVRKEDQTFFVPDLHDDYYQKYGLDDYSAFRKTDVINVARRLTL